MIEIHRFARRNVASVVRGIPIVAQSGGQLQSGATLASGDVKISKDGGSPVNTTNLPTEIGSSGVYQLSLTQSEANADVLLIIGSDQAGSEWDDWLLYVDTRRGEFLERLFAWSAGKAEFQRTGDQTSAVNYYNPDDPGSLIHSFTQSQSGDTQTRLPS